MEKGIPLFISAVFFAACLDHVSAVGLNISMSTSGSFSIGVYNSTSSYVWFVNGSTEFINNGQTYSSKDNSLKWLKTDLTSGYDIFGLWQSNNVTFQAGDIKVMTSLKTYQYDNVSAVIFSQTYLSAADMTSTKNPDHLISKYPSISLASVMDGLGFLSYGGDQAGSEQLSAGRFNPSADFTTGIDGGPIVLFNDLGYAMVISPMSKFMAASNYLDKDKKQISWGIMGNVSSVPANYTMDFILFFSYLGITDALKGWGNYLTTLYGKNNVMRDNDPTVGYIGYWTDNGAVYYYHTIAGRNYEQTMIAMDDYINDLGVPFKYYQYDSWWYYKGHVQGVKEWTPRPDIFPDGFRYLWNKTRKPIGCHNRFWDGDTVYARYNGGNYTFILDQKTGYAVPDDDQFWIDLLKTTQGWGKFILYEQDWLNVEVKNNAALLSDIDLGRRWLVGMGKAAALYNITIQYCMAQSRHMLQSLEIPVVTQARVSHDYHPGTDNWKIGISSMLADAVNLAPYKDTFWTTAVQPLSPYKGASEPQVELVNAISTLSTGPVGPSDGVGYINNTLLMRCCDVTGRILKPGSPLIAIDDQVMKMAFKDSHGGPDGEVYASHTIISGYIFGTILAADLKNSYNISPDSAWPNIMTTVSMSYSTRNPQQLQPVSFDSENPIQLGPHCTSVDFCLYYSSPTIEMDSGEYVLLMGELDKWAPISPQRIREIHFTGNDILIFINVQAKETVNFTLFRFKNDEITTVTCDNSKGSTPKLNTVIAFSQNLCSVA